MELPPPVPCSGGLWDARSWPSSPSPSFVCAGWQKSSGLLSGSGPSLLPNSFSVESLQAGMGGTGAPSEAGLSHPLAFSAGFLLSQNNSVGNIPTLAGGQQTRSWPMASSATPSLSKASQASLSLRALHSLTLEHFLAPWPLEPALG